MNDKQFRDEMKHFFGITPYVTKPLPPRSFWKPAESRRRVHFQRSVGRFDVCLTSQRIDAQYGDLGSASREFTLRLTRNPR